MKKIASFILAVLTVCAVVSFGAISASAVAPDLKVAAGVDKIVTDSEEFSALTLNGNLTVKSGGVLKVKTLTANSGSSITLEPGSALKITSDFTSKCGNVYVPAGATLEVKNALYLFGQMTLDPGVSLKLNKLATYENAQFKSKLTVCAGATVAATSISADGTVELYGTLKSKDGTSSTTPCTGTLNYHEGALFDVTFEYEEDAAESAQCLGISANGNRLYRHEGHCFYNGVCACGEACPHSGGCLCEDCGEELNTGFTASALSEGSLTVIVAVVCLAVGFLAAMFIFRKNKNAAKDSKE